MARLNPAGRWLASATLPDGTRQRKAFGTELEALQFEANPMAETIDPKVGPVFHQGFEKLWRGSKNADGQYAQTKEWIRLLGEATPCTAVTTVKIEDCVMVMQRQGLSGATINRKLNTVHMLMAHAVSRGAALVTPKVKKKREGGGRSRYFDEDEVKALMAHMGDFEQFAWFQLFTGCRFREAKSLRWQDCRHGKILLRWDTTKGGKTRTLPASGHAAAALAYAQEHKASNQAGPWSLIEYDAYNTRFNYAKQKVGLANDSEAVPHTLRHTCASWMVQAGVGIEVVQMWLGHADITTTMRYAHLSPGALDSAAVVLQTLADRCPAGEPQRHSQADTYPGKPEQKHGGGSRTRTCEGLASGFTVRPKV